MVIKEIQVKEVSLLRTFIKDLECQAQVAKQMRDSLQIRVREFETLVCAILNAINDINDAIKVAELHEG